MNPTIIHILIDGLIAMSGGKELVREVEENGYEAIFDSLKGSDHEEPVFLDSSRFDFLSNTKMKGFGESRFQKGRMSEWV